ncbi:HdeD family acid-resistance protein [Brevibacterium antiquum]|uniref:Uncharacterized membrane protein HdeD, DUF308 family n=1 Tax=Brevibacterium antiquum TaxID=234835 RepID=A0A2H1KFS5_9MICO|nr:hypothetical protein [Brevibacterium antiquum]SMX98637.1 Uncharacterized membrane protein HdeD, DUF308 family [Brevibacterium antiquum]
MSTDEPRTEPTQPRPGALPQSISESKALGAPMVVRGILGVAFGFATVFWPRDAASPKHLSMGVDIVDILSISYLVLFALALVYQGLRAPLSVRTAVYGQVVITIPAIVFLFLADQPAELRAALSIWALLHGLIELYNYRQLKSHPMASDFLIAAACHVLLGVILIFGDGFGALWILGFTGVATLIAGVIFIIGGYSRISKAKQIAAEVDGPDVHDTPGAPEAPDDKN